MDLTTCLRLSILNFHGVVAIYLILLLSFATLKVTDAQDTCGYIGHSNQIAFEPFRRANLYLDSQNPAPCAGTISNWTYCYYAPLFRFATSYIATFALYRKVTAENGTDRVYVRVSSVFEAIRTIFNWQTNQQGNEEFYCNTVALNYTIPLERGDMIGACVFDPADDFLIRRDPLNLVSSTSLDYSVLEYSTDACTRTSLPSNIPSSEFRVLSSTILHVNANIDPLPQPPLTPGTLTPTSKHAAVTTKNVISSTSNNNIWISIASPSSDSTVVRFSSIEPSSPIVSDSATIQYTPVPMIFSDNSLGSATVITVTVTTSIDITEETNIVDEGKDGGGGGLSNGVIIGNVMAFLVLIFVGSGIIFVVVMWKRKQEIYSTHNKITANTRIQSNAAVTNLHSYNEEDFSESINTSSNLSLADRVFPPTRERYDHLSESTNVKNTNWTSPIHDYATLGPYEEMQPTSSIAVHETSASSVVYTNIVEQNKYEDIYEGLEPYRAPATVEQDLYAQLKSYGIKNIPRLQIQSTFKLGSGQFGTVEQGVWRNVDGSVYSEVALKSLNGASSEIDKIKFLQEAAIMVQFRHPNVVFLYGVVSKGDPLMLVIELAQKGDLQNYLIKISSSELVSPQATGKLLLEFCQQIALGMQYLAGKGYIHRDLAARNVLVSKMDICKIADFGMSRDLADETYYVSRGGVIPVKWTAPEALHFKKYSTASDVWSYGCLLYEIWSLGGKPYERMKAVEVISHVDSGRRLPPPPGCPRVLYELMMLCWNPNTSQRPKFRDIFLVLIEQDTFLLSLPQEALDTHQLSGMLGAPLEAGEMMYRDLQNMYIPSTSHGVTQRISAASCVDTVVQEFENEYDYVKS